MQKSKFLLCYDVYLEGKILRQPMTIKGHLLSLEVPKFFYKYS